MGLEKRSAPRQNLKVPVVVSLKNQSGPREAVCASIDVSRSGMFMSSSVRFKVGDALSLLVRSPIELSGNFRTRVRCVGTVIHERQLSDGRFGYGMKFIRAVPLGPLLIIATGDSDPVLAGNLDGKFS